MPFLTASELDAALKNRRGLIALPISDGAVVVSPQGAPNEPGGAVRLDAGTGHWATVAGLWGGRNWAGGVRGDRLWLWSREGHEWQSLRLNTSAAEPVAARTAKERSGCVVVLLEAGPVVLGREPHRWSGVEWEAVPELPSGHARAQCATALAGGEVFAVCPLPCGVTAGGTGWSAARWAPGAAEWRPVAGTPDELGWPSVTTLSDDSVLLLSGPAQHLPGVPDCGAWRYDPAGDRWTELPLPPFPLQSHAVVPLTDGRCVVDAAAGAAVFEPANSSWSVFPGASERIGDASVAALPGSRVLVVGGVDRDAAWEIIDCSREAVAAAQRAAEGSAQ